MSVVFDSVSIRGLRYTHFDQLLNYLDHMEKDGGYYGNRKQFQERHKELREWLVDIRDYAKSEGVIIPKKQFTDYLGME